MIDHLSHTHNAQAHGTPTTQITFSSHSAFSQLSIGHSMYETETMRNLAKPTDVDREILVWCNAYVCCVVNVTSIRYGNQFQGNENERKFLIEIDRMSSQRLCEKRKPFRSAIFPFGHFALTPLLTASGEAVLFCSQLKLKLKQRMEFVCRLLRASNGDEFISRLSCARNENENENENDDRVSVVTKTDCHMVSYSHFRLVRSENRHSVKLKVTVNRHVAIRNDFKFAICR